MKRDITSQYQDKGKEGKMKSRTGVLVIDDDEVVRNGLRHMLEAEADMEVVGDCANAEEAFVHIRELSPDVVLMDIRMPGMDGIEATRLLKRNGMDCNADVIMLAECADHIVDALEAGAAGYVLKHTNRAELAQAIRQVYRNEHPREERGGSVEETVELVLPPSVDAAQTLRFINQVEKTLHASILQTVGSQDWGTVITILPKVDTPSKLLDKLGNMPNVEKVEEASVGGSFSNPLRRIRTLLGSRSIPRVQVTLN